MAKTTIEAKPGRKLYYVRNPIMLGGVNNVVRVIGYDDAKGKSAPYVIGREHVIEIPIEGAESLIEKWGANKCIEPYDPKRHPKAILDPVQFITFITPPDDSKGDEIAEVSQSNAIIDPDDIPDHEQVAPKKKHDQSQAIRSADPGGV